MTTTLPRPPATQSDPPAATTPAATTPATVAPATHGPGPADLPREIRRVGTDSVAAVVGGLLAGLCLTWITYEHILGFSGAVGFVIATWVSFLVFYAVVSAIGNPRPIVVDRLVGAVITSGSALVVAAAFSVIVFIVWHGLPAVLHTNFFTDDMSLTSPTAPLTQGGIRHAIVGSAVQIAIATALSLPLGVGTAVYLAEVGGRGTRVVRTVVEAMTALPDILAGLFVYTVLIIAFGMSKVGVLVSIALAVTMIPVIARSAEVVLRIVPNGLREASLALGASRWKTVRSVVLPAARSGVATALILGIARIAGETAPLLIVSNASNYFNANPLNNPQNSLPLFIFEGKSTGQPNMIARGYGAALLLLLLVLVLFVTARLIARDRSGRRRRGRKHRPSPAVVQEPAEPAAGTGFAREVTA